jgi:hypothetical protein
VRFVDCKNWDEWGKLFTTDAWLETEGGRFEGVDAIVAGVSKSMARVTTMHRVTMPEISFTEPDSAEVIWGQQDVVEIDLPERKMKFAGWGYYHEEYRRTANGWRIASSRLERLGKYDV